MCVVGHQPGVMTLRQCRQLGDGREVAVHAEDAVGEDQAMLRVSAMGRKQRLDMREIVVAEDMRLGARELRAREQAGMRQFVGENEVAGTGQRWHDAKIGEIARTEDDAVLGVLRAPQRADDCR